MVSLPVIQQYNKSSLKELIGILDFLYVASHVSAGDFQARECDGECFHLISHKQDQGFCCSHMMEG